MRLSAVSATLMLVMLSAPAPAQQTVIPIWPGKAPGSENWTQQEVEYTMLASNPDNPREAKWKEIRNVTTPTLTAFLPDRAKANGAGVLICPGGGLRYLAWEVEGTEMAKWLAARGVTAFVLKYRLVQTPAEQKDYEEETRVLMARIKEEARKKPQMPALSPQEKRAGELAVFDGLQALKLIRQRSAEWKLASDRIGIVGFSAGGYVAMGVVMNADPSIRPNFAAPIYGGGTLGGKIAPDAPPLFILAAQDDAFGASSSHALYAEWNKAGRSAELHSFAKGGHGFGMSKQNLPVDRWTELFAAWLESLGYLKRAQ